MLPGQLAHGFLCAYLVLARLLYYVSDHNPGHWVFLCVVKVPSNSNSPDPTDCGGQWFHCVEKSGRSQTIALPTPPLKTNIANQAYIGLSDRVDASGVSQPQQPSFSHNNFKIF
jgi:hypothetical protein